MAAWPLEWHALDLAELEKIAAQQWKKEMKLRITKLVEIMHQEQKAATQREATEAVAKTTIVATKEIVEDQ